MCGLPQPHIWIYVLESWARDNVTIFSSHKMVIIGIVTAVYSLWLLYVDIEALKFFVFFLVSEAPLHCRVEALSCCRCCKDKKLSRAQLWYSVLVNCREWDFHAASSAFEEPLCEVC